MKHSQDTDLSELGAGMGVGAQDRYAALHAGFRWQVDTYFNIADACCRRWANDLPAKDGHSPAIRRTAIRAHHPDSESIFYSYAGLQQAADALSHALRALGVRRGVRVAVVMPQRFETVVAYMAVLQMGAVVMPLSVLFGPEALEYRLQDSEAALAIGDESSIANLQMIRQQCPALCTVMAVGCAKGQGDVDYDSALAAEQSAFNAVRTKAADAAILIYTSGTTGPPKGALLAHSALLGNLPGFVCSQNWFGFNGQSNTSSHAVLWSPADWTWTGGLMDALLPTLYFGRPIVAYNGRFSPDLAFNLIASQGVTHTFLFPTALKAMMKAYPHPREHFTFELEAIMSAGEAVGDAVFAYARDEMGVVINEMFGQTEINYVVGNCHQYWPAKPGSMGKAYPGHQVKVIDDAGLECAVGEPGDVAVNRFDVHGDADPIFFMGYWRNPAATEAKFTGDWCRTGDMATRDEDGYFWYEGRADDVFKSSGYRIGPGEIENCLVKHPAVANAAVVPKPDLERGAVVKAYVVLSPEFSQKRVQARQASKSGTSSGAFERDLIFALHAHVKGLLAPYEYPKEIEFIDELPMTTTGKVQRRLLRLQEEDRFKLTRV